MVQRRPVKSSNLRSVGYDAERAVLEVEFRETGVYQYFDVPAHVYERLMLVMSKGRYFNEQIRDQFQSQRVEG